MGSGECGVGSEDKGITFPSAFRIPPLSLTIFFETPPWRPAFIEEPDSHGQIPI
jgi:hypothetical protein